MRRVLSETGFGVYERCQPLLQLSPFVNLGGMAPPSDYIKKGEGGFLTHHESVRRLQVVGVHPLPVVRGGMSQLPRRLQPVRNDLLLVVTAVRHRDGALVAVGLIPSGIPGVETLQAPHQRQQLLGAPPGKLPVVVVPGERKEKKKKKSTNPLASFPSSLCVAVGKRDLRCAGTGVGQYVDRTATTEDVGDHQRGRAVADRRRRLGEELSVERTLGGAAEEVVPRPRYEGIVVVVWAAFEHQHLQGWLGGGEAAREGAAGGAAWVEGLLGFLTGEVLIRGGKGGDEPPMMMISGV
jgi:hypothetical protein